MLLLRLRLLRLRGVMVARGRHWVRVVRSGWVHEKRREKRRREAGVLFVPAEARRGSR